MHKYEPVYVWVNERVCRAALSTTAVLFCCVLCLSMSGSPVRGGPYVRCSASLFCCDCGAVKVYVRPKAFPTNPCSSKAFYSENCWTKNWTTSEQFFQTILGLFPKQVCVKQTHSDKHSSNKHPGTSLHCTVRAKDLIKNQIFGVMKP